MFDRRGQALGGRAAEQLVFDDVTTGAANDLERVSQMARAMVTEYGMSEELGPITYGKKHGPVFLARDLAEERNYSEDVAQRIDAEVRRIVEESFDRARQILTDERETLDKLVEVLLERETLNQEEVEAIIETGELPPDSDPPAGSEPATDKPKAVRSTERPVAEPVAPRLPEAQTP